MRLASTPRRDSPALTSQAIRGDETRVLVTSCLATRQASRVASRSVSFLFVHGSTLTCENAPRRASHEPRTVLDQLRPCQALAHTHCLWPNRGAHRSSSNGRVLASSILLKTTRRASFSTLGSLIKPEIEHCLVFSAIWTPNGCRAKG